ncbi:MAG: hypothetical protein WBF90_25215 [Rivularia sp. (in: cyanobacteria)]
MSNKFNSSNDYFCLTKGRWGDGETRGQGNKEKSSMPNAQCPMPNAQCPMPNAQCPITNY